MRQQPVGIQAVASLSALGGNASELRHNLRNPPACTLTARDDLIAQKTVWVGQVKQPLLAVPASLAQYASRNLQLAVTVLDQLQPELEHLKQRYPLSRLGIVIGSSTSGIADNEPLLAEWFTQQRPLTDLVYAKQEMGTTALALRELLQWQGPAYGVSTACSSSAKALATAQRLINSGVCDAVLAGGVDSLCRLTLNGFHSLESLSESQCRPFAQDRDGINIGEAAALFILSRQNAAVSLLSSGESSDAWHISAPHPEGEGARIAMQRALQQAGLEAGQIGYLNLHGTATRQNDAMEAKAVQALFAESAIQVSSSKQYTGHCLGAAGAIEAAILHAFISDQHSSLLPVHGQYTFDAECLPLRFSQQGASWPEYLPRRAISNSFAFGGSNISLILGN
jgi:3-oxoacyl-[acyl-carrier-protein] synthase-1